MSALSPAARLVDAAIINSFDLVYALPKATLIGVFDGDIVLGAECYWPMQARVSCGSPARLPSPSGFWLIRWLAVENPPVDGGRHLNTQSTISTHRIAVCNERIGDLGNKCAALLSGHVRRADQRDGMKGIDARHDFTPTIHDFLPVRPICRSGQA